MRKLSNQSNFRVLSYKSSLATIEFGSIEKENLKAQPSVSIIIGPNGSGKSTILGKVIDEFTVIHDVLTGAETNHLRSRLANTSQAKVTIEYELGGERFSIARDGIDLNTTINGENGWIGSIPFPSKALAIAHLPVDKFRFSRGEESSFYSYLGLRQATNLTTTGALEQKLISSILQGYSRPNFVHQINRWLALIGRKQRMVYQGVRLIFRAGGLSTISNYHRFVDFAHELTRRRMGSMRPISREDFQSSNGNLLDSIWILLKALQNHEVPTTSNVRTEFFLNFERLGEFNLPSDEIPKALEFARKLRLLESTTLVLNRNGTLCNFSDLSSGEQQILGTMTRLLTLLESNSIVAIDEPEVSLHPAWQMQYVPTLLDTLRDYPSTHVLIATHSHFLVSDEKSEFANLIVSAMDEGPIFEPFDGEVYGRSPENILYRVFGVGASGNAYVEQDLARGLAMASGTERTNKQELKKIISRLSNIVGPDMEAIDLILDELKKNYENI